MEIHPCSKCGGQVTTFRDKAHKYPSSYCKPCNNKDVQRRRKYQAVERTAHDRLWAQKDRTTGERRYASRPCPEKCEVCGSAGQKGNRRPLDFDHCHTDGVFRGWLCHSCNMVVGYAKDNADLLQKLAKYLEDFELTR